MRHHNSVFHQIQKHVPWHVFDRLVDEHKADYRVRTLSTKSQFLALLFGQLAGAVSLQGCRKSSATTIGDAARADIPARHAAGGSRGKFGSGGPHAGFALLNMVCVAHGRTMHRGGATRARPEIRRMMSASDRRLPLPCRSGPDEASRTRSCTRPARIPGPETPRSATGPSRRPSACFARTRNPDARADPVAGLARPSRGDDKAASGARRPPPPPESRRTLRRGQEAFLPPGPQRLRSIRRRECEDDGTVAEGGDKTGAIFW